MKTTHFVGLPNQRPVLTFTEVVEAYMSCYQGRDPSITTRLEYWTSHFGKFLLTDIEPEHIDQALYELAQRGKLHQCGGSTKTTIKLVNTNKPLAPATINRYRTTLQSVLSWAKRKRLTPRGWSNPTLETERLEENNGRTRYLSNAEYLRLLQAATVSYWPKLKLLIMLAVTTGVRRGSLMSLKWSDIDYDNQRAYIERTKNGEAFVMVLLPEILEELKKFKSSPNDLIFCGRRGDKPMNFEKAYKNALKNAAIEGACFHTLRHTHASWLAQQGASLLAIADSMGHKSLAMTKRYAHLAIHSRQELLTKVFQW